MSEQSGRAAAFSKPPQASPRVSVSDATTKAKQTFKRNIKDEDSRPAWFRMVNSRGGAWYKVRSNNLNIFDKETNKIRTMRYCPGENSVWLDEQFKDSIREHVVFRDKNLVVPQTKPNLIKFLKLHPDNVSNGGTQFELVQPGKQVEENLDNEFLVADAIEVIKKTSIDELIPVAYALGVSVDQNDRGIKHGLVRAAKQNPEKFMSTLSSPMVKARANVRQAFDFNIVSMHGGAVVWTDTRKMIVSVPVGQDKEEVMTRFCMTDNGAPVLSEINRQLDGIA